MKATLPLAAALIAILMLGTPAAAASSPTSLYFHLTRAGQDVPLNTQAPADDWGVDLDFGAGTSTLRCLHPYTGDVAAGFGTSGMTSQAFHTTRAYGQPALVEYGSRTATGEPRMRPARGLWANVSIDADQPAVLHWYLRATAGSEQAAPAPIVPEVLVRATVRGGDEISVDDSAYDAGALHFQGQAGPVTLAHGEVVTSDATRGQVTAIQQAGRDWVYDFQVPLEAVDPVLRMQDGFNVRIDVLLAVPGCDDADASFMPGVLATHSSAGLRPRMDWSVHDLMRARAELHADAEGQLHPIIEVGTVFGAYDASNVTISLLRVGRDGPEAVPVASRLVQGYGPCGHDCGHTQEVQYFLDQDDQGPGSYDLTVSYDNLQGTAHQTSSARLTIEPPAESPMPPLPALLALLGLAVFARRR